MKTNTQNFWVLYLLLAVAQIIICNYCNFTPYVTLTLLPAMVMCIPTGISTIAGMLIAALTGLSIDFLSEGLIGLNTAAILPLAFLRRGMIGIFLGKDLIIREDQFSIHKNGAAKVAFVMFAATTLFLALYIILDGAGTRSIVFNLLRYVCSLVPNMLLCFLVTNTLNKEDRR